jgi:anti-sigma-K factor RskA
MTEEDDIDGLAAEYALGSLSSAERAEVEVRRRSDASLAAAIDAWQLRLGPLNEEAPGVEPPAQLFSRILVQISDPNRTVGRTADVVPLRGRSQAGRRRSLATIVSALAACLAIALVWFEHTQTETPGMGTSSSCGSRYKDFWEQFDRQKYARISAEQLAGLSRMALRAYDACEAGDDQDAKALFDRLRRMQF